MKTILFLLLCLAVGIVPARGQIRFAEKIDFPTGEGPTSIAIGDLNGDGLLDIVTSNYKSGSISLLIGTIGRDSTQPSFIAKQDIAVGENPMAVAVADLNGDGRPEVIVANYISNSISIFVNTTPKGNSVPTFAARRDLRSGERPYSIAIADLNGDGRPDIVVVDYKSTAVSLFLNTTVPGDTMLSLADRVDLPAQARPTSVAVADLNGDGRTDLVVANYRSDSLSLFLNETPRGGLKPIFTGPFIVAGGTRPLAVSIADFNGDGKPDIVASDDGANAVRVIMNETTKNGADPMFVMKAELLTGLNPQSVCCEDLDRDGMPDIVAADYNSASLSVMMNTTRRASQTLSFSPRMELRTGTAPSSVVFGSLGSRIGKGICVSNYGSSSVSVIMIRSAGKP